MTTTRTERPNSEPAGTGAITLRPIAAAVAAVVALAASTGCCRWCCRDDTPSARSFRYAPPPAVIPDPMPAGDPAAR